MSEPIDIPTPTTNTKKSGVLVILLGKLMIKLNR